MPAFICKTCGVQYPASSRPPKICLICTEARQYVNPNGQQWTTLAYMKAGRAYDNEMVQVEESLFRITTKPKFGIGQSAFLVQGKGGNVLWDCITLLDEDTIGKVKELGGIEAIALSHPHYYSTQAKWAETFDAPIYIHEDDREWVV